MNKDKLRKKYLLMREEYLERKINDEKIYENIINEDIYKNATQILTYVSRGIEVDTIRLIKDALRRDKEVYCPVVSDKKGIMTFHKIKSLGELILSNQGILEPDPNKCQELENFKAALCITPALLYNHNGYRIGYGGGYYDTFLNDKKIKTLGIIYEEFIINENFQESYDIAVKYIMTEKGFLHLC